MHPGELVRVGANRIVTLGEELGEGATGAVFGVLEDDRVAVKVYHETPPSTRRQVVAALHAALTKDDKVKLSWQPKGAPHVLPAPITAMPVALAYSVFDGETVGFAMTRLPVKTEYISLELFLAEHFEEVDACLAVARELARDVAFFHEAGLIVGDMSTENIFV